VVVFASARYVKLLFFLYDMTVLYLLLKNNICVAYLFCFVVQNDLYSWSLVFVLFSSMCISASTETRSLGSGALLGQQSVGHRDASMWDHSSLSHLSGEL
jgi:hypothetical protein